MEFLPPRILYSDFAARGAVRPKGYRQGSPSVGVPTPNGEQDFAAGSGLPRNAKLNET